jgi:hypothetical protein
METDPVSEMSCFVVCKIPDDGKVPKTSNPVYFSRVVGRVLTKNDERIANKKEYRMSRAIIFI